MRPAYFRDAGANYNDIVYFSRPADWRFQSATPSTAPLYAYFNFNLKAGPVVVEIPASAGATLSGTLTDAWETPLADVGPDGVDHGRGGKYILLPPGSPVRPARDYASVHTHTYNGYALIRIVPASTSEQDLAKAIDIVKQIRVYALSQVGKPPVQRYIDMAGKLFDGIVRFDDSFYDSLARMVNEESVQQRDLVAMGLLHSMGIDKGKDFKPDQPTRDILRQAAAEARAGLIRAGVTGAPYWPRTHWGVLGEIGPRTGFTYHTVDRLEIDERGMTFFFLNGLPKKLAGDGFRALAFADAKGEPLAGAKTYRLHLPPQMPTRRHWEVAAYDLETAGFIRESTHLAVDSADPKLQKNADGSVDIYFGPSRPAGGTANWIYTAPDRPWFSVLRLHAPERAVFEKTWRMPDIEQVD
jgi:hypothetical protein